MSPDKVHKTVAWIEDVGYSYAADRVSLMALIGGVFRPTLT